MSHDQVQWQLLPDLYQSWGLGEAMGREGNCLLTELPALWFFLCECSWPHWPTLTIWMSGTLKQALWGCQVNSSERLSHTHGFPNVADPAAGWPLPAPSASASAWVSLPSDRKQDNSRLSPSMVSTCPWETHMSLSSQTLPFLPRLFAPAQQEQGRSMHQLYLSSWPIGKWGTGLLFLQVNSNL